MCKTFIYKETNDCVLEGDLYLAENPSAPLIVYIHGGGLIWGAKDDILKEQVDLFNHAGYHVFSINYRLAPETKLSEIIEDIEDALNWLRTQNHFTYDRNRVAVIGKSAGAYLALTTGTFKEKPNVIVSLSGYGNIMADWYLNPSPYYLKTTMVPELLVKQMVLPKQISAASIERRFAIYVYCRQQGQWLEYVTGLNPNSDQEQMKRLCPIEKVNAEFPPTLLIHGDQDEDVPYEESQILADRLKEHHIQHELITIKNGTHTFDQNMNQPQVKSSFNRIVKFLEKHL